VLRALIVIALLGACGRFGFDELGTGPIDPTKPGDPALIVTRADDRMAGPSTMSSLAELPPGTVGLSLREALTIANHHAGADRIAFDASALPADPTITLDTALVVSDEATEIDAADVKVTLAGATGYTGTLLQVKGNDAVIDGLALRGGNVAIEVALVSRAVLRRLAIRDTAGDAIRATGCTDLYVEDSRIEGAGGDPLVMQGSTGAWIRRNFVVLKSKAGTVHGFWLTEVTRSHIIDNVIDPGDAHLISLDNSSDNELIGNILDRGDTGITVYGNSQRNLIFRNVVINPTYDSVFFDPTPQTIENRVINNTFLGTSDIVDEGMGNTKANNLVTDDVTEFVHASLYDFHLVSGHTAVDGAADVGQDMLPDDPARFLGSKPDLGAVESY
jgi:parallel beta-helix repeat protein